MRGGTAERYRPESPGRRGNGNGASPAWVPARAGRLLTGAGSGVRLRRDRLAERDSRMRQVASTPRLERWSGAPFRTQPGPSRLAYVFALCRNRPVRRLSRSVHGQPGGETAVSGTRIVVSRVASTKSGPNRGGLNREPKTTIGRPSPSIREAGAVHRLMASRPGRRP